MKEKIKKLSKNELKKVFGGLYQVHDDCTVYETNGPNAASYRYLSDAIAGCDRGCTNIAPVYIC